MSYGTVKGCSVADHWPRSGVELHHADAATA
jgi:hypothetical protein